MYKWTDEDHELVKILTAQGLTVAQISSETGLSVGGIKRSRAINRGQPSDPKAQQVEDNLGSPINRGQEDNLGSPNNRGQEDNRGQLLARVAQLEAQLAQLAQLEDELAEISSWVARKKKSEAKERGYSENTSTFQFKRAGPT